MAVCAVFISLMIFKLAKIPLGQLLPEGFFRDMLGEAVFAGCALAFVLVLKKTEIFKCDGEKLKMEWISAFMVFVMMALPAFSAVVELGHLTCSAGEFIMFLIYVFLIGFTEEVLFRGLVQNAFFRLFKEDSYIHLVMAVIMSGIIFGLVHLANAFRAGGDFTAALTQCVSAVFMGVYLGAVYFRTGKHLWYLIFVHSLYDAVGMISSGMLSGEKMDDVLNSYSSISVTTVMIVGALYLAAALFILRPQKANELMAPEDHSLN